ncbi:transcription factor bHLH19-like [Sesamum indicum]|uniref:Transcription factor bHLH19-like n=1 Tax=Sesamum indicum TaxID=4182 RepID=A0A6I9T8B2_SESIN|nr:transcription factor bHLH19-like [Sesamum indicum]
MRAGKRLLPEMEGNCDDMFGVEAADIPHEIYTSRSRPYCMDQLMVSRQTMITTDPSSSSSASSSSSYSSAFPRQAIYFENKNPTSSVLLMQESDFKTPNFEFSPNGTANLSSTILSFSSPLLIKDDSVDNVNQYDDLALWRISPKRDQRSGVPVRNPLQAREHLAAERKRREKIGQLFVALSKLVPGIKKLDKASILEDAIDYIKILEEQIRVLEVEQVEKRSEDIDNSTSKESSNIIDDSTNELSAASPIKVRISDNNVLINILCKKQKGFMSRIHMEMEKMNLCAVDVRVMPFGRDALDITILAQMQSELCVTVKDIVDQLDMAFLNPPHMQ